MNQQPAQQQPAQQQNGAAPANAAAAAAEAQREVILSKRLSFLLRHAPGKYIDLESKLYRGGWLALDGVTSELC